MVLRLILLGADLNVISGYGDASGYRQPGGSHVRRQDAVRPDHGLRAVDQLSSHRHALWRRSPGAYAQLRGAVPGPGLRSADVAREPARHRSLLVGAGEQALPHGLARSGGPLHAGRCQRGARLAHLARVGTTAHSPGAPPVCRGEPCRRLGQHRLRARFDHHRSVPVGVSVGALSLDQGRGEDAHPARSARQHPQLHPRQRRQAARCQRARPAGTGAGRLLRHGSRLHRLRASVRAASGGSVLRHSGEVESRCATRVLRADRPQRRSDLRPDHRSSTASMPARITPSICGASASRCPSRARPWCS